jgi:predicted alpha/beta superfamily hydrolase
LALEVGMVFRTVAAIAGLLGLLCCGCRTERQPEATLHFVVIVPEASERVFLTGNLAELGRWRPDGLELRRASAECFERDVVVPAGSEVEYKITQGDWASVEKSESGDDVLNRKLSADKSKRVKIKVEKWGAKRGDKPAARRDTLTGDIRFHTNFGSKFLENRREIAVYLPPQYAIEASRRFPVLYMHDGQNCFNEATSFAGEWQADETAQRLIEAGEIPPIIIVAVANAGDDRIAEYTPTAEPRHPEGGNGAQYAKFLMKEVKPFIDKTYRTLPDKPNTGVCGSSLGGLISLYIASEYPDEVGLCGSVSPSLWWDDRQMIRSIQADARWTKSCKIWLDMGTAETVEKKGDGPTAGSRALSAVLIGAGRKPERDYKYLEVRGGEHNEPAWAKRFDKILLFLFPKS